MQLGERAIKINPAKLPPTLIAHSGKGGDQGAIHKANEVQARLLARMAERKANEEVEAAAKEEAIKAKEARKSWCKAAGEESEEEKEKEQGKENNDSTKTRTYNCGLLNSPGTNQQTTDYTRREMPTDSAACRSFSLPPSPS